MNRVLPNAQAAQEIIGRFARSSMHAKMIEDDRTETITKRQAIAKEMQADLARLDAEAAAAEKLRQAAAERTRKAQLAHLAAEAVAWDHYCAYASARSRADGVRLKGEGKLRELADPRIEKLRAHVSDLHYWARCCFGVAVGYRPMMVGAQRVVSTNIDKVTAVTERLHQIIGELETLAVTAYGPDLRSRLQATLDETEALAAGLAGQSSAGLPPPTFALED